MKISTKTRYGLRFMVYLGYYYQKGPVHLNRVAKAENISKKYLEQIVPHLKQGGFLVSYRGSEGGYQLSRQPNEISVKDIVEVLEGPFHFVDCGNLSGNRCERYEFCAAREIWGGLSEIFDNYLSGQTLGDLAKVYKDRQNHSEDGTLMYYI